MAKALWHGCIFAVHLSVKRLYGSVKTDVNWRMLRSEIMNFNNVNIKFK